MARPTTRCWVRTAPAAIPEAVRIEIRPDRVVVRSPGGLPEGVSADDLGGRSVPRNVLAIRTLRFFGIAEDAGRGVRLMRDHMALNLMEPPRFEADDSSVTVTLPLGSEAEPAERAWLALTLTGEQPGAVRPYSVGDTAGVPAGLQARDAGVLLRAGRGETLTNGQVRELLGVDVAGAREALRRLRDSGLLQQRGNGAGAHYVLAPHLTGPESRRVLRSRPDYLSDVAIELAGRGRVANADLRKHTGIDRVEALRVLNALVAGGRLERRGTRRGSLTMIEREITPVLLDLFGRYPFVTVTGPRQSGKTVLCRAAFPHLAYGNLEAPNEREFAESDPVGFLARFSDGAILDEIQRAPDLLSYLQVIADEQRRNGLFVLTGSEQFRLSDAVSQSLAGRTALLRLLPFTLAERARASVATGIDDIVYSGFYPRIHDQGLDPTPALGDYVETYVERDVRRIGEIRNLGAFGRFLRLWPGGSARSPTCRPSAPTPACRTRRRATGWMSWRPATWCSGCRRTTPTSASGS